MPNSKFSPKDDRQIQHIIDSEVAAGKSKEEATSIAYGRVQNQKKGSKKKGKARAKSKRAARY